MARWTELSSDPNSPQVRDLRNRTLVEARREPVADRVAYLTGLCRGKRVLDVGVVDHAVDSDTPHQWLHGEIAKAASYCLGVDVLPAAVETLKQRGYNVRLADVTRDTIDDGEFDVMTCGEVIEHLENPGGLFRTAADVLAPGGRLVITTPNPYYRSFVRDDHKGRFRSSVDHVTLLFPSGIAEMAERAGLKFDSYRGLMGSRLTRLVPKLSYALHRAVYGPPGGDCFCKVLIYECVRT
jgi:SAM-dependent methyltransferase